ncbi:MAG: glycoside hydrolase family 30 protein [Fimbriimonas sp.]
MHVVTIHPERERQVIENFAASDSWTVEPLKNWPEVSRRRIADLLFDRRKGIGLSGWRFNLGGGINHETISIPFRTADTFEVGKGQYDWSRCPGQRWMLQAAKDRGVETVVAYAITPPKRLTRNGLTNGREREGTTNLKPEAEGEYAAYLVDIVHHFRNQGIPIDTISPINEPDYEWNAGTQEGNRASNDDIVRITTALRTELNRRNLNLDILTPEATSPQIANEPNKGMGQKYGATYGGYIDLLVNNAEWRNAVRPIYAFHDYNSDSLQRMLSIRERLQESFKRTPGLRRWQTEYCQMSGPRGEGGWGRDLGMTLALNTARLIHLDMTMLETSAWQWWLAVSDQDYKDGLIYVDDIEKPKGTIYPTKTLWALGNFSRFIRPGWRRVETEGLPLNIHGLMASAYRNPKNGELAVVLVNVGTKSETIDLRLPGQWTARPYVTSDRPGEDLKAGAEVALPGEFAVPSRSVVTLVCRQ